MSDTHFRKFRKSYEGCRYLQKHHHQCACCDHLDSEDNRDEFFEPCMNKVKKEFKTATFKGSDEIAAEYEASHFKIMTELNQVRVRLLALKEKEKELLLDLEEAKKEAREEMSALRDREMMEALKEVEQQADYKMKTGGTNRRARNIISEASEDEEEVEPLTSRERKLLSALREARQQNETGTVKGKAGWNSAPKVESPKTESRGETLRTKASAQCLRLECIDGPHRGEAFDLSGAAVIGRNPTKKSRRNSLSYECYGIERDEKASPAHAKIVLNRSGSKKHPVLTIKVTDLNSDNGTMINNKKLPKGSSRQAFVRDRIQIGESTFLVSK